MVKRRAGFTLIEIAACTVILAMMLVFAGRSLQASHQRASFEDVVGRLTAYEQSTRAQIQHGSRAVSLVYASHEVSQKALGEEEPMALRAALPMPGGYSVDQFLIADSGWADPGWRVDFSLQGRSRSYAVLITGRHGQKQWVGFCGLSGQPVRFHDGQEAADILAELAGRRADVD